MATHDDNSIEPTVLSDAVPVLERSSVRIPILKRLIADCEPLGRRSGPGGPERGGPHQDPRSRTLRLSDLRQGDCFEARQPKALRRRA